MFTKDRFPVNPELEGEKSQNMRSFQTTLFLGGKSLENLVHW